MNDLRVDEYPDLSMYYNMSKGAPYRKIKLVKFGSMYMLDFLYQSTGEHGPDTIYVDQFIHNTKINLMNIYLKDLPIINIKDDIFNIGNVIDHMNVDRYYTKKSIDKVVKNYKSYTKLEIKDLTLKVLCGDQVMYFNICIQDNGIGDVFIIRFIPDEKIAIINILSITDTDVVLSQGSPLYISSKERYVEDHIKMLVDHVSQVGCIVIDVATILSLVSHVLDEYTIAYSNGRINDLNSQPFYHTSFEVSLFSRVYQSLPTINTMLHISSFQSTSMLQDGDALALKFRKRGIPEIVLNPSKECPSIEFSKKEMNFVRKYVDKSNIFNDKEDAKNIINITDVLDNPRYGKEMMMNIEEVYGKDKTKEFLLNFSYDYDKESNSCDLGIRVTINDNIAGYVSFYFTDIDNFRFGKSLVRFESSIFYINRNIQLPASTDEVKQIIPRFLSDRNILINLAADIISIYCVLYERPDRSRVIRETTRATDFEHTIKKPGKRDRVYGKKTESYVIRRILKDTKSAKEYVSKMVSDGAPNREYTLEEWDRKGYRRRKPHSEETIWIEPTKCHRRLRLSDKEIHIKL